jgi:hypothetical protein
MRSLLFPILAASVALLSQACAAEASSDEGSTAADLSGSKAEVLATVLDKAKAPSDLPGGTTGVSEHVARIELMTAQGGIAHFISESGTVSTIGGGELGNLIDLGVAWVDVRDALIAGGAKFTTIEGLHGASSSTMLAKVVCRQVVSPSAHPSCTVSQITVTQADSEALMKVLEGANAPSNTPPGIVGSSSRIARVELTTAQGGIAHFISMGGSISTVDGNKLADILSLGVAFDSLSTALLDGGLTWTTTQGAHGASSSTMSATVECTQAVAPMAKPTCTISRI